MVTSRASAVARHSLLLALLALLTPLALPSATAQDDALLRAELDQTLLYLGDSTLLTLATEGQLAGEELDLSALNTDFHVLGPTIGTRLMLNKGRAKPTTSWVIHLRPKRTGRLQIPSLQVMSRRSPSLTLQVKPRPKISDRARVSVELLPPRPYVQAQTEVIVRLHYNGRLLEISSNVPSPDGATLERAPSTRPLPTDAAGQVIEQRYTLFPQRSGPLRLPPFTVNALLDRSGALPRQLLHLDTASLDVEVRPQPDRFQGDVWLPAKALTLDAAWQPGQTPRVGQPVALTLTLTARGLRGYQLPRLSLPATPGLRLYQHPPTISTGRDGRDIVAVYKQRVDAIPQRAGRLTLQPFDVAWWDTQSDTPQRATLQLTTLNVTAPAGVTAVNPPAAMADAAQDTKSSATVWQSPLLTALAALLWLATLAGWRLETRARRRPALAVDSH